MFKRCLRKDPNGITSEGVARNAAKFKQYIPNRQGKWKTTNVKLTKGNPFPHRAARQRSGAGASLVVEAKHAANVTGNGKENHQDL